MLDLGGLLRERNHQQLTFTVLRASPCVHERDVRAGRREDLCDTILSSLLEAVLGPADVGARAARKYRASDGWLIASALRSSARRMIISVRRCSARRKTRGKSSITFCSPDRALVAQLIFWVAIALRVHVRVVLRVVGFVIVVALLLAHRNLTAIRPRDTQKRWLCSHPNGARSVIRPAVRSCIVRMMAVLGRTAHESTKCQYY